MAKVKNVDRELVDMIRVAETATDDDIQQKLRKLYSNEDEREKRQHVQDSILTEFSAVEDVAVLSVASSRVTVSNEFRERLVRGILADEDYVWRAVGPRVLYTPIHAVSTFNCEIRALWQRMIVAVL